MKKQLLLMMFVVLFSVGCGASSDSKNDAHTHSYNETITIEATCETAGEKTLTCECGDTSTEVIPATGHVYENYVSNEDATYLADGTETATCVCGVTDTRTAEGSKLEYTFAEMDKTMYAKQTVNVRDLPSTDGSELGSLSKADEVHVTGQCEETGWYRIDYNDGVGYVSNEYLQNEKIAENKPADEDAGSHIGDLIEDDDDADSDDDGVVTPEEEENHLSDAEKAVIAAGYLNPVKIGDNKYAMLTDGSHVINGKMDVTYLDEYLASIGLQSDNTVGCWIDEDNGWYWLIAKDCYPIGQ